MAFCLSSVAEINHCQYSCYSTIAPVVEGHPFMAMDASKGWGCVFALFHIYGKMEL